MEVKIFELRDRATFIPIAAVKIPAHTTIDRNDAENYLLWNAGWSIDHIVMFNVEDPAKYQSDPSDWNDRTYETAHMYICKHFDELENGQVVDVEFILGEVTEPKQSQRLRHIKPETIGENLRKLLAINSVEV